MRVTFYSAVLLAAICSVVLGLDWVAAPMAPMPEAKNIVFVPPPPVAPRVAAPVTTPPSPVAPTAPPSPVAAAIIAPPTPVQTPMPAALPLAPTAPKVKCDVDACAAAYRSFRDSDCTYNLSFGPRRLCTKGDPERYAREHRKFIASRGAVPASTLAPKAAPVAKNSDPASIITPESAPAATPAAAPRCNVSACAAAYPRSFREA